MMERRYQAIVLFFASLVFLGGTISPPSLMDDVDAVQASIARTMLESGDYVTPRLNGVIYLEKPPLKYWLIAASFAVFGPHDWAARLPIALSAIALCWLTARFAAWAAGPGAGLWAGVVLATCVGLFLFTRILIADVMLTLTVTLAMWGFLRCLDEQEPRPSGWAAVFAVAIALGMLLKGLIAAVIPFGGAVVFLALTRRLFRRDTWRRIRPFRGAAIILAIAAPWHVAAVLANPPYLDFTIRSEPGVWRGFFWYYFFNEHLLRFLNLRYPRDYNTVPRHLFLLFHLLWLFPWSAYFPALLKLSYRSQDRAAQARLLALCWTGFLLAFFSLSTTQEYYSMPCYPALALLIGSALAAGKQWLTAATKVVGAVAAAAAAACFAILWLVRSIPAPGDIARALTQNPELYTLSLGHMADLTLNAFAYLKLPLAVAGTAFAIGAIGALALQALRARLAVAVMMVLFLHAARLALVTFDPYLSSRPLAEALRRSPAGTTIFDNQYYTFSSVFFYANTRGLLLNGRVNNLHYGSFAPGAPRVFIDDAEFARRWRTAERHYLLVEGPSLARIESLVGKPALHVVHQSGGKFLLTNQPMAARKNSTEALPQRSQV
ncbi:MAG: glycosyltransferase family 39 protein [Bryobacteraceae bacterium]|nr:glycosyltransferase family 39 protein [Bryobacteraceae bacterium]